MTLPGFLTAAAASWTILSCLVAVPIGRAMRRADDAQRVQYPPPVPPTVNWLPLLPPVPPPARSADDAAWLSVWPSALDDDELTDLEFVSLIASTWDWPDTEDADQ